MLVFCFQVGWFGPKLTYFEKKMFKMRIFQKRITTCKLWLSWKIRVKQWHFLLSFVNNMYIAKILPESVFLKFFLISINSSNIRSVFTVKKKWILNNVIKLGIYCLAYQKVSKMFFFMLDNTLVLHFLKKTF